MKERSKWLVLEDEEVIHVIPESDIKPHGIRKTDELKVEVADINCPCHPEIDFTSKKIRIIHNSFEDIEYLDNLIK
jgi:hypothetical protein